MRYAGVQHTYRSWILRNLGDPAAEELALTGLGLAGSQEILAQCHLDVADCLLRAGDLAGAADRLAVAETESGTRWFHNKWRFDQRRGLLLARLALAEQDAAAALDAAEPVAAAAEERGDARYAVLARLVRATAQARLGAPVDEPRPRRGPRRPGRGGRARGLVAGRRRRRRDRIGVRPGHGDAAGRARGPRGRPSSAQAFRTVAAARLGAQATATASTTTGANRSPVRRTASTASATSAVAGVGGQRVHEARAGAAPPSR